MNFSFIISFVFNKFYGIRFLRNNRDMPVIWNTVLSPRRQWLE